METTLIQRIDACCEENGWSRERACREAGLGRDYIRMIANGKSRDPKREKLDQLADVFECTYLWLATGKGQKDRYKGTGQDEREKRLIKRFRAMSPDRQDATMKMVHFLAPSEEDAG